MQSINYSLSKNLIILAGFPATKQLDGISFVTTLPAPTITLSHIVTPPKIITPDVIQHFFQITISLVLYTFNKELISLYH
jgi:hypothetical protein